MSLSLVRRPFNANELARVPAMPGIYVLWNGTQVAHIGRTIQGNDALKNILERHFIGINQPSVAEVTHFSYELSLHPDQRQIDVLGELAYEGFNLPEPR